MTERPKRSIAEWLALPEDVQVELIDGEFVKRGLHSFAHGSAHGAVGAALRRFSRRDGWWLTMSVDIELRGDGFRPDLAGWRRSRFTERPNAHPMTVIPDWVCEVMSPDNATNDTVMKMQRYHAAGVPHYWLLDPEKGSLHVYRHQADGYLLVLAAQRPQRVRAEPFDAVEYAVGELLGDDPED